MQRELTEEERSYLRNLLFWTQRQRPLELFAYNLLLIAGAALVIVAALLTVRHASDRTVILVTLPSFGAALIVFILYRMGMKRVHDCDRMVSILRKTWRNLSV
jgi:hypothetical protein